MEEASVIDKVVVFGFGKAKYQIHPYYIPGTSG